MFFCIIAAFLCSLHVPNDFGGRAGSQLSISCILLQGVLAPISLVGGGAWGRGVRSRARCELGLLLCLVASITPSGQGWVPNCWSRRPEVWVWAGSLLCFPSTGIFGQRRAVLSTKFWSRCLVGTGVCAGVVLAPVTVLDHSWFAVSASVNNS